jgi:hypothetical protein
MGGIYNAPISWDAVRWGVGIGRFAHMAVPIRGERMSTHDSNGLTTLVLACHQARIRLNVSPHGPRGLMLWFSRRDSSKTYSDGHPDIDEAVEAFRRYVPADHRITYQAAPEPVAA